MKILLASHRFFPEVGGTEVMTMLLARGFVAQGHEVVVVTQTEHDKEDLYPFKVLRKPSFIKLWQEVKKCDVYFHNNIGLQTAWPLLLLRRPWVIAHHTWLTRPDGSLGRQEKLKRFVVRFATNISISQSMADHIPAPSTVISNPYRDDLFFERPEICRDRDLVFLGRLVSDKGLDLLLEALSSLQERKLFPSLSIIGTGPELANLQHQVTSCGLDQQVEFLGVKSHEELSRLLNQHRIMVVPSRWKEPFGLVALEGAACGCVVIGSQDGGLKDAIGPCGVTFPSGNVSALADAIGLLLNDEDLLAYYRAKHPQHLQQHKAAIVTAAYLRVLKNSIKKG